MSDKEEFRQEVLGLLHEIHDRMAAANVSPRPDTTELQTKLATAYTHIGDLHGALSELVESRRQSHDEHTPLTERMRRTGKAWDQAERVLDTRGKAIKRDLLEAAYGGAWERVIRTALDMSDTDSLWPEQPEEHECQLPGIEQYQPPTGNFTCPDCGRIWEASVDTRGKHYGWRLAANDPVGDFEHRCQMPTLPLSERSRTDSGEYRYICPECGFIWRPTITVAGRLLGWTRMGEHRCEPPFDDRLRWACPDCHRIWTYTPGTGVRGRAYTSEGKPSVAHSDRQVAAINRVTDIDPSADPTDMRNPRPLGARTGRFETPAQVETNADDARKVWHYEKLREQGATDPNDGGLPGWLWPEAMRQRAGEDIPLTLRRMLCDQFDALVKAWRDAGRPMGLDRIKDILTLVNQPAEAPDGD